MHSPAKPLAKIQSFRKPSPAPAAKQTLKEWHAAGGGVPTKYKGREHVWHAMVDKFAAGGAAQPAALIDGNDFVKAAQANGLKTDNATLNKIVARVNKGEGVQEAAKNVAQSRAAGGEVHMAGGGVMKGLIGVYEKASKAADAMMAGQKVLPAAESQANLAKMLEKSKVKNRAYHATDQDVKRFDPKADKRTENKSNIAGWMTNDPEFANDFAAQKFRYWKTRDRPWEDDPNVPTGVNIMPVHLAIDNPFYATDLIKNLSGELNMDEAKAVAKALGVGVDELLGDIPKAIKYKESGYEREHVPRGFDLVKSTVATDAMKRLGHDGVIAIENGSEVYAPFKETQIKSAIGNRGTYDLNDPDITKAHGGAVRMQKGGKSGALVSVAEAVAAASKKADEILDAKKAAGKLEEVIKAKQAPMVAPQGTGLPLMPRSQGMYIPDVKQEDLPRMPKVDKARAEGKQPAYTERMQDLLDSPTARKKVDKLINKGKDLDVLEWYGIEPLRQVAMNAGRTPEQFESLVAQLASASQRNPVDQQNKMGSYLHYLSQTGQLPDDAFLLTNKIKRGKQEMPAGTPIELPPGYGSLAQGDIFGRGKQIASGDIMGALPPDKKLGTFYRNYLGNLKPVTVDVNAVRGPIIERGDPRWLASKLVEKDEEGNVIATHFPRRDVAEGRMSLKEAKDRPGFWEAAPSGSEYAGFEDLWQRGAKRHDIEPAEAQALGWYGSADVTALKTKPELYVDNLERMIKRTAEQTGRHPLQVLEDIVSGKGFLYKEGGLVEKRFDDGGIAAADFVGPEDSGGSLDKAKLMANILAEEAKKQGSKETGSLSKPRATTDLLNRGVIANNPLSAIVDMVNMGLIPLDILGSKLTGRDIKVSSDKPFLGSEHVKDLMNKYNVTSGEERPMMETALSFLSPAAMIKGAIKATDVAKKAPELVKKASDVFTSSKIPPLATEAKTAQAGKPTGVAYATKQEGPFYRVTPTNLDTSAAKTRGIKEANGLQSSAPLGGGAEQSGREVPKFLSSEEVGRIIADPVANEPLNIAKKYTQDTQGADFGVPQVPSSSLAKQSGIARTFDLAVQGSPEYKSAIFGAYGREMPELMEKIGAKNYDDLMEKAYRQMAKETDEQFRRLPYNFSYHRAGEGNYNGAKDMASDVHGNKHLYVYQGGDKHDFLHNVDPQSGLNENEKFRAVHDLLGHAIYGNEFGPKGEEMAWAVHQQMYSPLARMAMTAETRGQNSVVNYSPLNAKLKETIAEYERLGNEARRRGDKALLNEISELKKQAYSGLEFAPNKAVLLPPEFMNPQFSGGMPSYLAAANKPKPGTFIQSPLTHFSNEPGLTFIDPRKYGTGIKGAEAERLMNYPGAVRDRSYFYMGEPGTVSPEPGLGVNRYRGEASSLYDITQDPLDFRVLARESNRTPYTSRANQGVTYPLQEANDMERLVREYGYQGMANPKATKPTAIMFGQTPVQRQKRGGLSSIK